MGICGSDIHWWLEGAVGETALTKPVVPGHELAGWVVGGPLDGHLVAVDPAIPCGHCAYCRAGHANLCPAVIFAGHGEQDGALRELMAWPAHRLTSLPDGFTAAAGALLEPMGVALHATDLAHLRPADTVAVVGLGPIGLLAVQLVRAAGAGRVIGVDPLAHRRQAAISLGADAVLAPAAVASAEARRDALAGADGADRVFEIAGTDSAIAEALELARPGARVMLAGIPDDDHSGFPAGLARRKGLTLVMVRRMKDMYPRCAALVQRGLVDLAPLVTGRFPLAQAPAAFDQAAARSGLKVIIEPQA
jgi:L-iditol 2-dehydrogenase